MGFQDPALAGGSDAERLSSFRRIRDEIHDAFLNFYNTSLQQ
jgi:hypothetical protein